MQNNPISRSSSACTNEGIIVGSFSGSESENNYQSSEDPYLPENEAAKNLAMNDSRQHESNSIKHKILKLFCCR